MDAITELVQFLQPDTRPDIKDAALGHILSLTGSAEGKATVFQYEPIIEALLRCDHKYGLLTLINLTADDADAQRVYELACAKSSPLVERAVANILAPGSPLADYCCMLLANLTRSEQLAQRVLTRLESGDTLAQLAKAFATLGYNKQTCTLDLLGQLFCNITQLSRGRELLLKSRLSLLDKILPFTSYEDSALRRYAAIGILKNICFDPIYHDVILKDDNDDVLTALLYPLCGPEEFTDEENDKLPIELQFLPDTKTREPVPEHRKMLLECLLQLCATKRCRELLRDKCVYELLRELHKWEAKVGRSSECVLACENVVDILLNKEHEIGLDNLKEVVVPADVAEKIEKDNADYVKNLLD